MLMPDFFPSVILHGEKMRREGMGGQGEEEEEAEEKEEEEEEEGGGREEEGRG